MAGLICFRLRRAVLVAYLVLFEQLFHLLGDHLAVVRHRDERDLFAGLGRLLGRLGLFGVVAHNEIIHQGAELFECFERGLFSELPFTPAARDEIDRFAN